MNFLYYSDQFNVFMVPFTSFFYPFFSIKSKPTRSISKDSSISFHSPSVLIFLKTILVQAHQHQPDLLFVQKVKRLNKYEFSRHFYLDIYFSTLPDECTAQSARYRCSKVSDQTCEHPKNSARLEGPKTCNEENGFGIGQLWFEFDN